MPNVKPGDRAIIVGALHHQCKANIGRVVRVVREHLPGDPHPVSGRDMVCRPQIPGPLWVVESLSGPLATLGVLRRNGVVVLERIGHYAAGVCVDAHLRRLPDPDEVREHDAQAVPAADYFVRQREGVES